MSMESTLTSWADETWPGPEADEILPGLFQGGTADDEVIGYPAAEGHYARLGHPGRDAFPFDLVVTLYADAQPAPWGVLELRFGFPDGILHPADALQAVALARLAHQAWRAGDRVLVRCQAGVNRSGLVAALILMLDGYQPVEAIELLRSRRSPVVLANAHFATWLVNQAPGLVDAPIDRAA